jgi:hypothetical protein
MLPISRDMLFLLKLVGMNNGRLEGFALEGYFHTLVRHQVSICEYYCKYDTLVPTSS